MEYTGALKQLNMNLEKAGETRILQLHKFEEFKREAHENVSIYKERTKAVVWQKHSTMNFQSERSRALV